MSKAMQDVMAERYRQTDVEGYTPEHDDHYSDMELQRAAAAYCLHRTPYAVRGDDDRRMPHYWPWKKEYWKPRGNRENLVRAAALLVAAIEAIDRNHERALREAPF